jgi:hypothetical protein
MTPLLMSVSFISSPPVQKPWKGGAEELFTDMSYFLSKTISGALFLTIENIGSYLDHLEIVGNVPVVTLRKHLNRIRHHARQSGVPEFANALSNEHFGLGKRQAVPSASVEQLHRLRSGIHWCEGAGATLDLQLALGLSAEQSLSAGPKEYERWKLEVRHRNLQVPRGPHRGRTFLPEQYVFEVLERADRLSAGRGFMALELGETFTRSPQASLKRYRALLSEAGVHPLSPYCAYVREQHAHYSDWMDCASELAILREVSIETGCGGMRLGELRDRFGLQPFPTLVAPSGTEELSDPVSE